MSKFKSKKLQERQAQHAKFELCKTIYLGKKEKTQKAKSFSIDENFKYRFTIKLMNGFKLEYYSDSYGVPLYVMSKNGEEVRNELFMILPFENPKESYNDLKKRAVKEIKKDKRYNVI